MDLGWQVSRNGDALYYEIERSTDNRTYTTINKQNALPKEDITSYYYTDDPGNESSTLFYRLKIVDKNGAVKYSRTIAISKNKELIAGLKVMPNPVKVDYSVLVTSPRNQDAVITIADVSGRIVERVKTSVQKGSNVISLQNPLSRSNGMYVIRLQMDGQVYSDKMLYTR